MRHVITLSAAILLTALPAASAQTTTGPRGHSKTEFLRKYDTDLDGKVSRAEYEAVRSDQFTDIDSDGDGTLTEQEYVAEYTARLDQELEAMRKSQIEQAKVRFGVMDSDKSARMTAEEFARTGAATFDALDTDKDGVVGDRDTAQQY
jgi:Ca2+-binding EF-hand superfamily protein